MLRAPVTHMGDGRAAVVLEERQGKWPGFEAIFRRDDISHPTDWRIHERRHSIIIHLGGCMHWLETELDGFGGSCGPALPGEIWTAPAERRYASHAYGTSINYAIFFLEPETADIIPGPAKKRHELAPLAGVRDEFLHQAARTLKAAIQENSDVSAMMALSLTRTISFYLYRTYQPGKLRQDRRPDKGPVLELKTVRRVREFIHEQLGERITLAQLAGLAGLTVHQFLIAFRKTFGLSPAQYVIQQRLRSAQRQLVSSKKDITTIALETGFASHSHLTAYFTKRFGRSPSAFRSAGGRA